MDGKPGDQTNIPESIRHLAVPIDSIHPYPGNPRRHDLEAIAASLANARRGQYKPITVNRRTGDILAGNGTWEAARDILGWTQIAVTWVDVDDATAAGIVAVDNRSSDLAGYDDRLLADLLGQVDDLASVGYTPEDLDALIRGLDGDGEPGEGDTDPDDTPEPPAGEPVTKPGDLWLLGDHRLLCGNSALPEDLDRLLDGRTVGCVLADPPYGMNLDTDYSKMPGRSAQLVRKPKKYRSVEGDDEPFDASFLRAYFAAVREQFWFGADYYRHTLGEDDRDGSWLVWDKRTEEQDDVIGSGFELCWSASKHQRRLLRHYWCGAFGNPEARNRYHPTQKPTALLRDILDRWAPAGCLVADPHGGSGSTLIAAHQTGRKAALVELDPRYCDVAVRRWTEHSGQDAKREDGAPWSESAA